MLKRISKYKFKSKKKNNYELFIMQLLYAMSSDISHGNLTKLTTSGKSRIKGKTIVSFKLKIQIFRISFKINVNF